VLYNQDEEYFMSIKSDSLRAAVELMNTPRDFEIGDLVTWKDPMLINARNPKDCKDFGICVRFQEPVRGSDEPGSNHFNDWKDTVIGFIDEDGDYMEYCANSLRFKKFSE